MLPIPQAKAKKIIKRPFLKEKLLQKKNTGSLVQHYTSLKNQIKLMHPPSGQASKFYTMLFKKDKELQIIDCTAIPAIHIPDISSGENAIINIKLSNTKDFPVICTKYTAHNFVQ